MLQRSMPHVHRDSARRGTFRRPVRGVDCRQRPAVRARRPPPRSMTDTTTPCFALRFEFDEAGGRLRAHYDPGQPDATAPGHAGLVAAIEAAGFGALFRIEEAMARFQDLAATATAPVHLDIAERRDGECRVLVARDAMSASLEVSPAFGGRAVDRADVDRALAAAGVVFGLDEAAIAAAIAEAAARPQVVAAGTAVDPGQPVRFESLVPEAQRRGPRVDERGVADYRDLGTLVVVHAGDPLMRRRPAVAGRDGRNVLGAVVPAPAHPELPFTPNITGAGPAADDSDRLVARIAGQPVVLPHGVSVLPTIEVASVDLSTGNLDFDGTVTVTGHVAAGMRVTATGDVFVRGHVEAAHIQAGGNIAVSAGAIGRVDGHEGGAGHLARLVAGGDVGVQFCEHVAIEAGGDVQVGQVALHSLITAGRQILIGQPGGRRSQLIGGVARCASLLQVATLGSTAAVATEVEVGHDPAAHATVDELEAGLASLDARLGSVRQVLDRTGESTDPPHVQLHERAQRTLEAVEAERAGVLQALATAQQAVARLEHARIVVREAVHPNVEVRICGRVFRTREDGGPRTYALEDGEIVLV